jgi:histidinol-phosphate/aromatic aminotransferase/cobyric acid decarboxylase-like protein
MEPNIKTIRSKELSSQWEPRYVVVNTDTGEILDDAQGYGYKSPQNAYAAYAHKSRSRQQRKEIQKKERAIFAWLKEHKDFEAWIEDAAFQSVKCNEPFTAKTVNKMLTENGYTDLPFTAAELLRSWQRGKPQYGKKKH